MKTLLILAVLCLSACTTRGDMTAQDCSPKTRQAHIPFFWQAVACAKEQKQ